MKNVILFTAILFTPFVSAYASDVAGSKDPANINRYEGSSIIRYEQLKFDKFTVPLGKMTKFDFSLKTAEFENSENVEGSITRVSYHVPDATRSSLEIFRNYEQSLKDNGWNIAWQASGKPAYGNAFAHIYESLEDNDQLFTYNDQQGHVLVAKRDSEGLTAVLFVTKFEMGLTRGIKISKGDPIIQLDVIQKKLMEQKMIIPTSSEMNKAISETGRIALYGILFDFNSAAIKNESKETLVEIASLLKTNSNLKLLVAGHTDNVGNFEFNKDLSEKRAASVVNSLVSYYGIQQSRLKSFGVSYASPVATNNTEAGRAKNRRVELVEISE